MSKKKTKAQERADKSAFEEYQKRIGSGLIGSKTSYAAYNKAYKKRLLEKKTAEVRGVAAKELRSSPKELEELGWSYDTKGGWKRGKKTTY